MSSTNPTDFNKRLGAAVRTCRIMAGLTQESVGTELGVTFQQIQKYEKGVNRISVETLLRIAKAIKTTSQELIDQATPEKSEEQSSPPANQPTDRMKLEIVRGLSRMPQKSQRIALDVINALAGEEAA